jgi:hypothetical protein
MSSYIGNAVKNGLVLHLDAANSKSYVSGSGVWRDLSGNNNSGSLTNGPTFSSDGRGSIVFDNTDDYINCGVIPSLAFGTGGFTMNVWFSIASTGIGGTKDWVTLIAAGGWAAGNFAMILNRSSSHPDYNKIQFNIMNGTTYKPTLDPSGGIIVNKWYNVTVTRNSSTISVYVLGQFVGSYTDGANITATQPFWIGQEGTGSGAQLYPFHGKIPMVQIYNRGLSAAEILENYNATKGRFDTPRVINSVQPRLVTNGLVMCLDAGNRKSYVSGSSTWVDLSGNNNGTLTNGPTFNSSNGGNVVFDGTNDYVEVSTRNTNLEFQPTQAYSVFGWFYNIGSSGGAIVSNMYDTGTYPGWDLWNNGSNTIAMHLISTWSANAIKVKINFNYSNYTSAWVYFGYTYNGSCPTNSANSLNSVNFYQNGILNADGKVMAEGTDGFNTTSETISYNSSQRLRIGSRWLSGTPSWSLSFRNSMIQIYNRALSADEVLQNYNATKGRFGL